MKKLIVTALLVSGAVFYSAGAGYAASKAAGPERTAQPAAGARAEKKGTADQGPATEDDAAEWTDPDSEKSADLERKSDSEAAPAPSRKEYVSIRKKRKPFEFHMGFSLGAQGYGAFGPRRAVTERYRYRYEKGSFNLGFRGGVEAYFFIMKRHCLSAGFFYEQRKIQVKIVDLALMAAVLNGVPPALLYFMPLEQRIDKSNIDTNYFAFPITYRFYILDEFYTGLSLDLAVPFQARARYGITFYGRKMDFRKVLRPVDFGGRLLFGFTMNRVFLEIGIGCGFIDLDRIEGERHPLSLTGMMGYRI